MRSILFVAALLLCAVPAFAENYPGAVVQVLDKITTARSRVALKLNQPVMVGTLKMIARACQKTEAPETTAFIEVYDSKSSNDAKKPIFSGWMFRSAPSVSALEHAVYDVTLLDCSSDSSSAN